MIEESGKHPKARDNGMRIPEWTIPVAISLAGVCAGWGVNAQRMTELDRRTEQQAQDQRQQAQAQRDLSDKVSGHETKIEVVKTQFTEIIRRLDAIDKKLEEQGKGR